MRILLDHCVDWRLARSLPAHSVRSTADMGWQKLRNGNLLAAAAGQFDVMLTVDQNIRHQQNLAKLPVAVVVVVAKTNRLADLLPLVAAVEEAFKTLQPQTLMEVSLPVP